MNNINPQSAEKQPASTSIPADSGLMQATASEPAASSAVTWVVTIVVMLLCSAGAVIYYQHSEKKDAEPGAAAVKKDEPSKGDPNLVKIEENQKAAIGVEPVQSQAFQSEKVATGKITFSEDLMTPVFAEYTGRIIKIFAKTGDSVEKGALLYEIDSPDLVQVEADLISAVSALRKSKNALNLAKRGESITQRNIAIGARNLKLAQQNEARQKGLVEDKAASVKDYETAQRDTQQALRDNEQAQKDLEQALSDIKAAESDIFSGETGLNAIRDRLRVFGKSDEEIEKIQSERLIDRITRVKAPIAGTITSRKIGLGQYVSTSNTDPMFIITDMSKMWLVADVYEIDAPKIKPGQSAEVSIMALPGESFKARVSFISPSVNPDTRRVGVRCEIDNAARQLKSEMFASFRILTDAGAPTPAVSIDAIVRDGTNDIVFVEKGGSEFMKRIIERGVTQGRSVQVLKGLEAGERVVNKGAVFLNNTAN